MYRNLRIVPQLIYGRGSIVQLGDLLSSKRMETGSPVVFMIDEVHEKKPFVHSLPLHAHDFIVLVNVDTEPKTAYVDDLTHRVKVFSNRQPDARRAPRNHRVPLLTLGLAGLGMRRRG